MIVIGQGAATYFVSRVQASGGGSETWAQTLVLGRVSGGTNPKVDVSDVLEFGTKGQMTETAGGVWRYTFGSQQVDWDLFSDNDFSYTTDNGGFTEGNIFISSSEATLAYDFSVTVKNGITARVGSLELKWDNGGMQAGNGGTFPMVVQNINTGSLIKYQADPIPASGTNGLDSLTLMNKKYIDDSTEYIEKFGTIFNNTVNADWEVITVPGASANAFVQIQITNTSAASRQGGVRKVGSGLERVGATNSDSYIGTVMTNATGQIEIFASIFGDINFRLYGEIVRPA